MTAVPSRLEWRGFYEPGTAAITVRNHKAFGWFVARHVMPIGAALITRAKKEVPRGSAPNLTLYVRGRASLTAESGHRFEDRVPGMFSGDRPNTPAGACRHDVIEELEFWCFNWHANRGALPDVQVLRVLQGESFNAPAGQRVLLCIGSIGDHSGPCSFVHDGGQLIAGADSYGFLIGGDRV